MNVSPDSLECYEIARELKTKEEATTADGWSLTYSGDINNPRLQAIVARKGDQKILLQHYRGAEGIAQILMKARNNLYTPKP